MINKILLTGFAIAFGALIVGSSVMCAINTNALTYTAMPVTLL